MNCAEARPLLGAHHDNELDARASLELAAHLRDCPACRAELADLKTLGDAARAHLQRFEPTPGFERRLAVAIRPPAPRRRVWLAAGAALAVAAVLLLLLRARGAADDRLVAELVDAHTRSLLVDHATDVKSSDQHTVKPWFNGKVPFGVPVADFADAGFPLAGGRLDYVDGREVAALVYTRRSHTINVFLWPQTGETPPSELAERGYSMLHFAHAGLAWWLITDASPADLRELQRLLAALSE
jgi:anti-sigma factor RsiW